MKTIQSMVYSWVKIGTCISEGKYEEAQQGTSRVYIRCKKRVGS